MSETTVNARWSLVFCAWLVSLAATLGALFLGEVMGMTPCVLCWYQRIAMFPLAVILYPGVAPFDGHSIRHAMPLAAIGWLIAAYHCLLFWGVIAEDFVQCGSGPSCKDVDVQVAGVLPIPLLSLGAFTLIIALLLLAKKKVGS
jgi:disulfide bond formation protein DsbB